MRLNRILAHLDAHDLLVQITQDILNISVVIPALNPGAEFVALVGALAEASVGAIVVVDDGSDGGHQLLSLATAVLDNVVFYGCFVGAPVYSPLRQPAA